MKVLAVQYKIQYLNIAGNLRKISRILNKYKHLKPDLVIFPEYSLTGPLYGHYNLAFKEESKILKYLQEIAKKHSIYLLPGSFILKKTNCLYNSTCLIDPQGKIIDFYYKRILWSSEKRYLKNGMENRLFNTNLGTISIQICADLNSPLISHENKKLKPHMIINLAMWSKEDMKACTKKVPEDIEYKQTELLVKSRAIENKCYFIFCNFAEGLTIKTKKVRAYKETSIGNSIIVNPYGEIIAKTSSNKEEIIFSDIDISRCHWAKY